MAYDSRMEFDVGLGASTRRFVGDDAKRGEATKGVCSGRRPNDYRRDNAKLPMTEVREPRLADDKSEKWADGFQSCSSTGHRIDLSEFGFQGSTIDLD